MYKRAAVAAIIIFVLSGSIAGIVAAVDGTSPPWQASGTPTMSKLVDLPANILPPGSNYDCIETSIKTYPAGSSNLDCLTSVPHGHIGHSGIVFSGTSESIPVEPAWPFQGLQPIPGQSMTITYVSSSVVGSYMHFYKSFRSKMSSTPQFVNGRWLYTITGPPDITLKDSSGKALVVNRNTQAFSPNGSWMVVDLPWQGIVRVNLATFEMQPFAQSLHQGNDYSDQRAQISITNDGTQVVVRPNNYDQFKVYDLTKCTGAGLPVVPGSSRCPSRDYYDYLKSQIAGMRGIYQPRFINDTQISFTTTYDYANGSFKAASYILTAPGESSTGIQYLGLGDSFASGEGAFMYMADTDTSNNRCHQSTVSYAFLFRGPLFDSGHSVACSGATSNDFLDKTDQYRGQVRDKVQKIDRRIDDLSLILANYTPGFLSQSDFVDKYKPQVVSLSVGGNDMGFSDIVKSCVSALGSNESCYPTYEDRLELANKVNGIFDKLVNTYKAVYKPSKQVYVIGYPQIAMPGGNCAVNVHLDSHELQLATDLIDYLNLVISRAAEKAGVAYVDVAQALHGHRMCENKSYNVAVNGITAGTDGGIGPIRFIGSESYHPNRIGHELLAAAIRSKTSNLTAPMPAANPASKPPAVPGSLTGGSLPKSGRTINAVVSDNYMVPDLLTRNQDVSIKLDATVAVLKALSLYKLVMHSDPIELGVANTDAEGNLVATIRVPDSVKPGFHTLHVYGPNMLGRPMDITKTVYVAASEHDYDGDGIPNTTDTCTFIAASSQDTDKDDVDDACDGYIGEQPAVAKNINTVKLTNNSISITLIKP